MSVSIDVKWHKRDNCVTGFMIVTFLISVLCFAFAYAERESPYNILYVLTGIGYILHINFKEYLTTDIFVMCTVLIALSAYLIYQNSEYLFIIAGLSGPDVFMLFWHVELKNDRTVFGKYIPHIMAYYAIIVLFTGVVANIGRYVDGYLFGLLVAACMIIAIAGFACVVKFFNYTDKKLDPFANFVVNHITRVIPDDNLIYKLNPKDSSKASQKEISSTLNDSKCSAEQSEASYTSLVNTQLDILHSENTKLNSALERIRANSTDFQQDIESKINNNDKFYQQRFNELQNDVKHFTSILEVNQSNRDNDWKENNSYNLKNNDIKFKNF